MNNRNKRTFEITSIRRTFELTNIQNNELKAEKQYPEKALKANALTFDAEATAIQECMTRSNVLRLRLAFVWQSSIYFFRVYLTSWDRRSALFPSVSTTMMNIFPTKKKKSTVKKKKIRLVVKILAKWNDLSLRYNFLVY